MTAKQRQRIETVLAGAYGSYKQVLTTHAYFKLSDRVKCEDLVQDTFIRAWGFLARGGNITRMKAFLYRILDNLIIDQYRKAKTASLDLMVENGFEPREDDETRLFDFLDGCAAKRLIYRLPEKYRDAIRMRYMQGLSLAEISSLTGESPNTIAVRVHRGLEQLKSLCDCCSER